jgi:HD-GYP domain-containing protein (c-di-GMP phosphodiesterase class II)
MRGAEIDQFAAIAAVADVFAAMTAERPHRPAHPASAGVAHILGGPFDREVVDAFRRVVAPYPPGTELRLADGTAGVVAAVEAGAAHLPLVRLPGGERRVDARVELA